MPEGLLAVIGLLAVGYILMLVEIFVPGGIIGILGLVAVGYGCYAAFELGTSWGVAAVTLSLILTAVGIRLFVRSRMAKRLVLDGQEAETWKAAEHGLDNLLGRTGVTITPLRPAGMIEIDEERIDVVADNEFIDKGIAVRVCEIEGNRVVVEIDDTPSPADGPENLASAGSALESSQSSDSIG